MMEKLLIENCAPTLANLKTASLFTVLVENPAEWQAALARWRGILGGKGVSLEVLRDTGKTRLLYVYRESRLARDLSHGLARCILCGCGYAGFGVEEALDTLKSRIAREGDFPHEIGLFLGYPPEDAGRSTGTKRALCGSLPGSKSAGTCICGCSTAGGAFGSSPWPHNFGEPQRETAWAFKIYTYHKGDEEP